MTYDTMSWDKDAGMLAGIAAIVDYTGIVDRLVGVQTPGLSAAVAAGASVFLVRMIYLNKHSGAKKSEFASPIGAAISSGVLEAILNMVLGQRVQNQQMLGAIAVFLGTYMSQYKVDNPS
jgi:energy-converting hydrogenase Eha subunit A